MNLANPTGPRIDRRNFLTAGGALASTLVPMAMARADDPRKKPADRLIAGKSPKLITLEEFPAVLETPLELLLAQNTTPVELLFVRNNQQPKQTATTKPSRLKGWKIGIGGLVNCTLSLDAETLASMDQVEYDMVLQCSGNSRALFAQTVRTKGTQWGRGGMGNVRFAGVPLGDVLRKHGIEVESKARFVRVLGRDEPLGGKEDFEHSLPIDDVLATSILALKLNGQPLPAIHGGPVRLITPGVYGTMQFKWLSGLRFESAETKNYNQIPRYRVPVKPIPPGEKITYTFDNSRFNWRMKLKSVVLSPAPGARLASGPVSVRGVAFNDGHAKIDSVLVSTDRGGNWHRAKLTRPKSPYAWTAWQYDTRLKPGRHSLWARAVDALGRSQPLDGNIHWNPSGYEWNGVEKIDVTVS